MIKDLSIPDRLVDKTSFVEKVLHKHHTWYTHLLCIILRTILAILIAHNYFSKDVILILASIVVIIFGYKFLFNVNTWKVYLRTVVSYSAILGLQLTNTPNANTLTAALIIGDALLGLQSRYIASVYLNQ